MALGPMPQLRRGDSELDGSFLSDEVGGEEDRMLYMLSGTTTNSAAPSLRPDSSLAEAPSALHRGRSGESLRSGNSYYSAASVNGPEPARLLKGRSAESIRSGSHSSSSGGSLLPRGRSGESLRSAGSGTSAHDPSVARLQQLLENRMLTAATNGQRYLGPTPKDPEGRPPQAPASELEGLRPVPRALFGISESVPQVEGDASDPPPAAHQHGAAAAAHEGGPLLNAAHDEVADAIKILLQQRRQVIAPAAGTSPKVLPAAEQKEGRGSSAGGAERDESQSGGSEPAPEPLPCGGLEDEVEVAKPTSDRPARRQDKQASPTGRSGLLFLTCMCQMVGSEELARSKVSVSL